MNDDYSTYRTFSSYYFDEAFRNTDMLIERATRKLQDVPFDTLVGTGVSGTIFVPILAHELDKHWMIVRKDKSGHSTSMLEGQLGHRWLFCDDLIYTGATLKRVRKTIKDTLRYGTWHTVFGGTYLYGDNVFKPARISKTMTDDLRSALRSKTK
jgi:phosphoribosylpyrophosphate synthetase